MINSGFTSPRESTADDDTQYGSDFSPEEEHMVDRLISSCAYKEDNPVTTKFKQAGNDERVTPRTSHKFPSGGSSPTYQAVHTTEGIAEQISDSIKRSRYSALSSHVINEPAIPVQISNESFPRTCQLPDIRSPLERFRTKPKKPLSVTDLASPAWCELQYWYTLTIHGKKKLTPAMKQGTRVHQRLEDEVHTNVRVDIETKEDAWGLRILNVIQGLRTLREIGHTRELEIWGIVDGQVINGKIDELSYKCPDVDLEKSYKSTTCSSDQTNILQFFRKSEEPSIPEATKFKRRCPTKKIYICDVKTRAVRNLPSESAFRPTRIQLMLYHRLISALATKKVDFETITARYNLDTSRTFSDSLVQVGSLNDEEFFDAESNQCQDFEAIESKDWVSTLLTHNNLPALWSLMISEFQLTLPDGHESLSPVLSAEFRSRDHGGITGVKTFLMNDMELTSFIENEMQWWKGEREAQGVVVEEAFKCRSCDFAADCDWRLRKVQEAKEKFRSSRKASAAI